MAASRSLRLGNSTFLALSCQPNALRYRLTLSVPRRGGTRTHSVHLRIFTEQKVRFELSERFFVWFIDLL